MKMEIQDLLKDFFDKLGVTLESLEVIEEIEDIFFVKIQSEDSGLLIGTHGVVFESIQNIIRSILNNKFDRKIKIHFEINDYIHNKDEKLFAFVNREISRAKETGRNMKLPKFSAYERKKIHDYIGELNDSEIFTESRGEGNERRLYIVLEKNRNNNYYNRQETPTKKLEKIGLTIDLDGDDI